MAVTTDPGAASPPAPGRSLWRFLGGGHVGDRVFHAICSSAALLVVALTVLLIVILVMNSTEAIVEIGFGFFLSSEWDPDKQKFGALAFVYGTVLSSAVAMLIAVPLGVGTAAFLSEIAPQWLRRIVSFAVEMLAAIPSVVYGFWGILVMAPWIQTLSTALGGGNTGGRCVLSASLVLAVMIVPYVTAVSFDVCQAVPSAQRQGALALGATRWQMIWTVVLPYARPGILAASFIALGRALGETMAATMLIGGKAEINFSLLNTGDTMASKIAANLAESSDLYRSALIELGLILFLVTLCVNVLARTLIWQMSRSRRGPGMLALLWQRFRPEPKSTGDGVANPDRAAHNQLVNRLMTGVLGSAVFFTVVPLFFILGYLLFRGVTALDLNFFTQLPKPAKELGGGMANALWGRRTLVGLATLVAVPVGLLAAIYLSEYKNGWLSRTTRFIGELLGGVPSIVIGIYAYGVVVVPLKEWTDGEIRYCAWAGSFALAVMMLPIVMRASEEALKLVPHPLRSASLALGANTWQTIIRITVPAALPAIITAVFLSIARIAGETAPLLLTAGDNPRHYASSPNEPTPSIPVFIYRYSTGPDPGQHQQAWAAALVLLTLVMLLNFGIRWLTGKRIILASL